MSTCSCGAQPTQTPPIACSLDGAGIADRARQFHALAARSLTSRARTATGAVFIFRADAETAATVRELARLEKECCPFFDFSIDESAETIRLGVNAPAEGAPFVDALFETLSPVPPPYQGGGQGEVG
jgi:hypothetical protein